MDYHPYFSYLIIKIYNVKRKNTHSSQFTLSKLQITTKKENEELIF